MRTGGIVGIFFAALAMTASWTACETRPTPLGPPQYPGPVPARSRLDIVGPGDMAPGATAQFNAIAHLSDGSSRDVTNEASWTSWSWTNAIPVISIAGSGLATARERGDAFITAHWNNGNVGTNKEVIVVPPGTYRLRGAVTEAADPPGPVVGARLEVAAGAGAGLATTTDRDGAYRLYGVAGATNIRVTKEGYPLLEPTVEVLNHQTFNIALPLPGPRATLSGTYTLTITAADECGVGLGDGRVPEPARVRRYAAAVTQTGSQLEVALAGATFDVANGKGDHFEGRVEPGRAVFSLEWNELQCGVDPDLVELLATSTFLVVAGTAVTTGPGDRLAGMLDGSISVHDGSPHRNYGPIAWCSSPSHRFVLSR